MTKQTEKQPVELEAELPRAQHGSGPSHSAARDPKRAPVAEDQGRARKERTAKPRARKRVWFAQAAFGLLGLALYWALSKPQPIEVLYAGG
ncbi:MAG: hypothetical protein LAP40_25065 [Acidobacteriia bacterium]|nr:hypothetical protein [Terriglobia bacterium]